MFGYIITREILRLIYPGVFVVTLKDIAEKLNLHHTTVSKALRDHPDIKKETREKIKTLAEQLDYHPNVIAQNFKNRKTNTIGVIVPSVKVDFFSTVISAIEAVVYDAGYNIMISQSHEELQREILNVRSMVSNQVAGVAISVSKETKSSNHLKSLKNYGIPIIVFDRIVKDFESARIVVDDYRAAYSLTEYLIERGYRHMAHLAGPPNTSVSADRYAGFCDALTAHELTLRPDWIVKGGFAELDGFTGMQRLLKAGPLPRAVFAVNDLVALGAFKTIKKAGLRIPKDIAVAGYGDVLLAQYMDPPLTTVAQFPEKMGQTCAELLLRAIKKRDSENIENIVIPTKLVVRNST